MSEFVRIAIPAAVTTQKLGQMVLDKLATGYSVEVLSAQGRVSELRVWVGVRHDGSNGRNAVEGNDY